MEKNISQMFLECSCIPKKLIDDIEHFLRHADMKHAEESLKLLTPEQLDMFYKLNKVYKQSSQTKEEADHYTAQILISLVPTKQSEKLQDIRRFLKKCECPHSATFDYRHTGSFHNYSSVKKFFENLGMKIE